MSISREQWTRLRVSERLLKVEKGDTDRRLFGRPKKLLERDSGERSEVTFGKFRPSERWNKTAIGGGQCWRKIFNIRFSAVAQVK